MKIELELRSLEIEFELLAYIYTHTRHLTRSKNEKNIKLNEIRALEHQL
jgi:hypothetical protein